MQLSIEDLKSIAFYLTALWHGFLFRLIWNKIKKQTIFIDPEKYQFHYTVKKLWVAKWKWYIPIAVHGKKVFITPEKFTKAKEYEVLFYEFNI